MLSGIEESILRARDCIGKLGQVHGMALINCSADCENWHDMCFWQRIVGVWSCLWYRNRYGQGRCGLLPKQKRRGVRFVIVKDCICIGRKEARSGNLKSRLMIRLGVLGSQWSRRRAVELYDALLSDRSGRLCLHVGFGLANVILEKENCSAKRGKRHFTRCRNREMTWSRSQTDEWLLEASTGRTTSPGNSGVSCTTVS